VERALAGIAAAERATAVAPPSAISAEHAELIRAAEALPDNQDGADKSWLWPAYEFCRRHFRDFRVV
jgi:hypothetical protein